jgi:hypothetical protein
MFPPQHCLNLTSRNGVSSSLSSSLGFLPFWRGTEELSISCYWVASLVFPLRFICGTRLSQVPLPLYFLVEVGWYYSGDRNASHSWRSSFS